MGGITEITMMAKITKVKLSLTAVIFPKKYPPRVKAVTQAAPPVTL
jgi:hypothetical protein